MFFDPETDVDEARQDAEALMLDQCRVDRPTGQEQVDPVTHVVTRTNTPVYPAEGQTGSCRIKQAQAQANHPVSGGYSFTAQGSELLIPWDAPALAVNDVVTVTAAAYTPALAGKTFRITDLLESSFASEQRARIEALA